MTKPNQDKPKKAKPAQVVAADVELSPDAWPKFEKLIKSAAKMGPKPHSIDGKKKDR
jgi:hypothetical protein